MEERKVINNEGILLCDKGDMLLYAINNANNNTDKKYRIEYTLKNLNTNNIDTRALMSTSIYSLIEKTNRDLIDKIEILDIVDNDNTDVIIILKHLAREIGFKQKYIIFRTTRYIDYNNKQVVFKNTDILTIDKELHDNYINIFNNKFNKLDKCDKLLYKSGYSKIIFKNIDTDAMRLLLDDNNSDNNSDNNNNSHNNNNNNIHIDVDYVMEFNFILNDILPEFMKDFVGLMFKKMFYNVKKFIDSLNTLNSLNTVDSANII